MIFPVLPVFPVVLLIIGTVLICMEMFIPGFGICGISGILLVVISAVITVYSVPFGAFFVLAQISAIAIILYAVFQYAKRKQLYSKIILDETLAEDVHPIGDLEFFLGKEGVTRTPLRPFGEAIFNGIPLEVVTNGSYIAGNMRVKVTSIDGQRVIVSPVEVEKEKLLQ